MPDAGGKRGDVMSYLETVEQPRCPHCGVLMGDAPRGFECRVCGHRVRIDFEPRLPPPTDGSRTASSPPQSPVPPRFIGACSAGSLPNQARQNNDVTVVEVYEPPQRMFVRAKGCPIGDARVTIDVKPRGRASMVRIQQEAVAGPGRLIPEALLDLVLYWRNTEALQRLAYLAEGMARSSETTTAAGRSTTSTGVPMRMPVEIPPRPRTCGPCADGLRR